MAPKKRPADDVEIDEKPDLDKVTSKKGKPSAKSEQPALSGEVHSNGDGEKYLKLSEYRRVTVRKYKGDTYVDIRDFYKDKNDGSLKPGAKGISLKPEQWRLIRDHAHVIDSLIDQVE